jgi:Stealth protein CR2, conserved region 2/Stealth protein CR3, conserved region 3/Stealth protein CR1, conserved region 1/Stealth protein CR4, conserved region 4
VERKDDGVPVRRIMQLAPWPIRRRILTSMRRNVLPRVAPDRRLGKACDWVPLVPRPVRNPRAEIDDTAAPASVRRRNVDRVVTALDAEGIDWFRVPAKSFTHTAVAVPASDRARVEALLAGAGLVERPQAGVLRVSWPVTDSGRRWELGAEYGCEIEFWQQRDGNLVGPRSNPVADVIPAGEPVVAATEPVLSEFASPHDTAEYRTREVFTLGAPDRITFPIDVVYTWVDGADPAWLERKARALGDNTWVAGVNGQTANNSRFACRDELRYSMRALHCFAPWVRRIFLVTDNQVPAWLDTEYPQVTVVSHREVFGDTGRLPTFNSQAIESRLHRIDGLAEHFLYLNDDVFLARPVSPTMFFTPGGLTRFFPSTALVDSAPRTPEDAPVNSAGKNNRRLIQEAFGRVLTRKMLHTPHPSRRTVIDEIEQRFAEHVEATAGHQFRHPEDISLLSSLQQYYAYLTGRAAPGEIRYMYTDLADPHTPFRLARLLHDRHLDAFCLNDTDSHPDAAVLQATLLDEFLPAFLPFAAPFELSEPRPATTPIAVPHIPVTRAARAATTDRVPAQGSTARPSMKPANHPATTLNRTEGEFH